MPLPKTPKVIGDTIDDIIDHELSKIVENRESFSAGAKLEVDQKLIPELAPQTYQGYHHVTWYVSNSRQSAFYFITCFGFEPYAYKGLETGARDICSYVIKNGGTIFEFCSPLKNSAASPECEEVNNFLDKHGDGVKDVAFRVSSLFEVVNACQRGGARIITHPVFYRERCKNANGSAIVGLAKVRIFGDTDHTLIEKEDRYDRFLPGYKLIEENPHLNLIKDATIYEIMPKIELIRIDHCVQNQGWNKMTESCEQYATAFGFHQFWSVDEEQIATEYSALRSIVMSSPNDLIKMPINEPAKGKCKSQIEEFLEFYDGPGVQHIALLTDNIIDTVSAMKDRGVEFIDIPSLYYEHVKEKMDAISFVPNEAFEDIKQLGILIDFDEKGYLLQLFTKPLGVRPTIFIEVIQRRNHNGFGAGNFKALFESLEELQRERGNLTDQ